MRVVKSFCIGSSIIVGSYFGYNIYKTHVDYEVNKMQFERQALQEDRQYEDKQKELYDKTHYSIRYKNNFGNDSIFYVMPKDEYEVECKKMEDFELKINRLIDKVEDDLIQKKQEISISKIKSLFYSANTRSKKSQKREGVSEANKSKKIKKSFICRHFNISC